MSGQTILSAGHHETWRRAPRVRGPTIRPVEVT